MFICNHDNVDQSADLSFRRTARDFDTRPGLKYLLMKVSGVCGAANLYRQSAMSFNLYFQALLCATLSQADGITAQQVDSSHAVLYLTLHYTSKLGDYNMLIIIIIIISVTSDNCSFKFVFTVFLLYSFLDV